MVKELVELVKIVVEFVMCGMRFTHGRGRRLALRAVIETKIKLFVIFFIFVTFQV